MTENYLAELAEFAANLKLDAVPANVQSVARAHVLDFIGVAIGGNQVDTVRHMARRLADQNGAATAFGLPYMMLPRDAALVNGTGGTWLDYDAGHRWSGGHMIVHVLPAALAIGEKLGASGEEFLAAFIVGCEIGCRIGLAKGPSAPGLHPHGSWPVIGAVAAVGRICGLSAGEIRRAFDLVSTLTLATSWSTAFTGASVRNVYAGLGAQLAISAVEWVLADWEGEPDGVGVVFGSIAASGFNRKRAVIGLGERWEFTTTYLKPYSFARFGHSAMDVLTQLREGTPFAADDVARIDVATAAIGARMKEQHPTNELGARFSIPQAAAVLLKNGRIRSENFVGDALTDPALRAIAGKVFVRFDPEWEGLSPEFRGATVKVSLKDGTVLEGETDYMWGDPENPMTPKAIVSKYEEHAIPVLGTRRASQVRSKIRDIAKLSTVSELTSLLGTQPA